MKRTFFIILLTLLLALAAGAAGVAGQGAAVASGESASPAANLTETEWNGAFNSANPIVPGDVIAGTIRTPGDVDNFALAPGASYTLLIDVDAWSQGSPLDAVVCAYDSIDRHLFGCSDNADGADPLLAVNVYSRPLFLRVASADPAAAGPDFTYKLMAYRPLYVSAATGGAAAGLAFGKADVLAHYDFADGTEKWMLFFDASDVGVTQNVTGLAFGDPWADSLALTLQGSQQLPVLDVNTGEYPLQTVTPYDVLWFEPCQMICFTGSEAPGQIGPRTAGYFSFAYRGGDVGLTGPGEKLDALTYKHVASTTGNATFSNGLAVRDEDIANLPYGERYFEGARVPGLAAEDVFAADAYCFYGCTWYLTILGNGRVDGLAVTQKDIFTVDEATYRVTGKVWSGPAHHFNYNLDAFDAVD